MDMEAILKNHERCSIKPRTHVGETGVIWSCGIVTSEHAGESNIGFVDLHRDHMVKALSRALYEAWNEAPEEFLKRIQSEASGGFHKTFGWVDDNSSVAKALRALITEQEEV